jgi:UDP:flavonoid glycosyltransferase YjiC (YdhE family)
MRARAPSLKPGVTGAVTTTRGTRFVAMTTGELTRVKSASAAFDDDPDVRLALAPHGTRGDVHPMVALAEGLIAAGHDAVICAPPDFEDDVRARGIQFRPVGRAMGAIVKDRAGDWSGGTRRSLLAFDALLEEAIAAQFADLPAAVRGADLILGAGVQVGAPSIAASLGIRYRYVAYCPALLRSREHAPILFPTARIPRWANRIAWWLVLRKYEGWLRSMLQRARSALGLGPIARVYEHVLGDRPLLACDADLAPLPRDARPRAVQVGYLRPRGNAPIPSDVAAFLDAGPPPVYVGFGSMSDDDPDRTTRMVVDAVSALGRRALISHGGAGLARMRLPADFLAVGDVDHDALFPRTAAVVHHGGAGTTATAARAGAPQVVVPHLTEQVYWGGRIAALGVGPPPIKRDSLSVRRLVMGLRDALDPRRRERAASLRLDLLRHDPVDQAIRVIDRDGGCAVTS